MVRELIEYYMEIGIPKDAILVTYDDSDGLPMFTVSVKDEYTHLIDEAQSGVKKENV